MAIKQLYFLPVGYCCLDHSALNFSLTPGQLVEVPVWSFLLETSDGPILVDTGMPDSFVNNPDYYKGSKTEGWVVPNMSEKDRIVNVLKRVGYYPDDIQAIISSHLHVDHAGGNGYFRNAPIFIQRSELDVATRDNDYTSPECRLPNLNYQIIDGDHEMAPGIQILSTPGHAPGHQSVLVTTEKSGPVLLTIDVAYTRENFEDGVPFLAFDPQMAAKSIQRMHELIDEVRPSVVFLGHDRSQARDVRLFPDFI